MAANIQWLQWSDEDELVYQGYIKASAIGKWLTETEFVVHVEKTKVGITKINGFAFWEAKVDEKAKKIKQKKAVKDSPFKFEDQNGGISTVNIWFKRVNENMVKIMLDIRRLRSAGAGEKADWISSVFSQSSETEVYEID